MNWLVRRIVDGYRALAQKIYTRRYGTMARQLGRQEVNPPEQEITKGSFIIIQIDGLGYDHLVQAIARGAAPHLKRLIGAGRLRLASWRCGFPSTTPAVQAGIMFGYNWDIPGFRWYEKSRRRAIVCKRPTTVQALQRRISDGRRGILDGGFTLSALRAPRFFEGVRGLGLTLLFLLSPLRVLRVIGRALWNYFLDVGRRLLAIFRPSVFRPFDLLSPMAHIFTQVLFQEIITFGVQMDIYRGAPAIYLNITTYDEAAHHVGPTHPAAFGAVKAIDRQIARIDKMLTRYRRRDYDLYILSDHGMSPSTPFQQRFGLSLGNFISQHIDESIALDESWSAPDHTLTQAQYLLDELHGLEERLSLRGAAVVRATRGYLSRRVPWSQDREHWDAERHSDVAVRVSGPLAHIYFNVSDRRLNLSEIALLYPTLLNCLIEHPGIGLVVGREGEETVMMSRRGTLTVDRNLDRLRGRNPLSDLQNPHEQAAQIDHVASFPHAGDLMLLGAWHNGQVITFEDQIGTHGGVGGPQERPFILYPAEMEWSSDAIKSPCDLYPIFARYLNDGPAKEVPDHLGTAAASASPNPSPSAGQSPP